MDKVYFHHLMLYQVKQVFCLLITTGLALAATLEFTESHRVASIIQLLSALLIGAFLMASWGREKLMLISQWALLLVLSAAAVQSLKGQLFSLFWVYVLPLYICFVFQIRLVLILNSLMVFLVCALVISELQGYLRFQVLFSFLLSALFAFVCLFGREISERKLKSLINFDPVIRIYNEYQLEVDLAKEMTRADRLTEELHIVTLSVPKAWFLLSVKLFEMRMRHLGKKIRGATREFDTCYRLNSDAFVILRPHSSKGLTEQLIEKLEEDIHQDTAYPELKEATLTQDFYAPEDEVADIINRVKESCNGKLG